MSVAINKQASFMTAEWNGIVSCKLDCLVDVIVPCNVLWVLYNGSLITVLYACMFWRLIFWCTTVLGLLTQWILFGVILNWFLDYFNNGINFFTMWIYYFPILSSCTSFTSEFVRQNVEAGINVSYPGSRNCVAFEHFFQVKIIAYWPW